jgi:hypothetical protein
LVKPLALVVLCVSLLAVHSARAADVARGSARVVITKGPGTEQCIGEGALRRAVEYRLRRSAFRRDLPVTLEVHIAFERSAAGWAAELTMHDGSARLLGRRAITTEAAHCSALDDSLALVVALLVDSPPSAPEEAQPPAPATAAAPTGADVASASQPAAAPSEPLLGIKPQAPQPWTTLSLPRDTAAPREPWRFDVSLGVVAAAGTVPGIAPGAELGVGAQAPRLPEIRLFGNWFTRRDQQRPGSNSGAHFDFADVGLELCALDVRLGALRWFGCAGQTIGRLRVASYGFDQNTTSERLTYALLARTGLRVPLAGRVSGRLGVRAELPLARGVFDYGSRDGQERGLFEMKQITAVLDLGLIAQL